MPFNPSGIFVRLYRWVADRDNSIPIDSTRMDAEIDGMVTGINNIVNQTQPFTGPVKSPAGTALTPGHSFSNDPDTGMFRTGANTLGFSTGGANRLTISNSGMTAALPLAMGANKITSLSPATSPADAVRLDQVLTPAGGALTGPITFPSGTEAAPGAQWGNPNNGIYWVAGSGPSFTASGSTIGQLRSGTALAEAYSIVTRGAGDARYMRRDWTLTAGSGLSGGGDGAANRTLSVDSTVLRTTGTQTITGAKTYNSNVTHNSNVTVSTAGASLFFDADGNGRNAVVFRRGGNASVLMRHEANNNLSFNTIGGARVQVDGSNIVTQSDTATVAEARAGAVNDKMMTPLRVAQTVLGVNQSWVDVLGSRSTGTVYQNTTGRPITVNIEARHSEYRVSPTGSGGWVTVGVSYSATDGRQAQSFIVPNGHYYQAFRLSEPEQIHAWAELR